MHKDTHFAILKHVLKNAPEKLRDFFEPMSDDEIAFYCWVSDEIDRDSLTYGYWYHSWKLKKVKSRGKKILEWVRGSLPLAMGALYWDCRNKYREGNFVSCRQNLIKMSHYTIDSCTMPHVVDSEANFMHKQFEEDIRDTVSQTIKRIRAIPLQEFEQPFMIYDEARRRCEEIYTKYKERLIRIYKQGRNINDKRYKKLRVEIIKDCCIWTLTALWATYDYMMFPSIA